MRKPSPTSVLVAVGLGGAVGALLRHVFTVAFPTDATAFPLTTFAENILGAFLLGFFIVYVTHRVEHGNRLPALRLLRPFLCVGVLGSFTTFSHFSIEMLDRFIDGHQSLAVLYGGLSTGVGLLAAFIGMAAAGRCRSALVDAYGVEESE